MEFVLFCPCVAWLCFDAALRRAFVPLVSLKVTACFPSPSQWAHCLQAATVAVKIL